MPHRPIFVLSTGDIVTVTVDISTTAANIKNVTYTLHVPAGVMVTQVAHIARGPGIKEIYKVYQDNPTWTYTTDTVVATQSASGVEVIAYTRLNGVSTILVSGYNSQHLVTSISSPQLH
ncbi:MAG TPA: hypothetical protein VJ821_03440 [Anaerolineales bacterium]|nr:hypothetical protein [Anaerolineales bacterium]